MEAPPPDQDLTAEDRQLLLFGYLGPLAFVALVASRREFVKWHAKQGLVLSATLALLYPLLRLVQFLLDRFVWVVLGEMFRATVWIVLLGVALTAIVCIVRGLDGERFRVPGLSDLADRL